MDGIAKTAICGIYPEKRSVEDLGDSMKITSVNGWIAQWQKVCELCRTGNVGGGRWRMHCVTRTAMLADKLSEEERELPGYLLWPNITPFHCSL